MKKLVFCALIALAIAPTTASAATTLEMETTTCQSRIYNVLRQAAEQLGESYDCICNAYENGEVTVVKEGDVYRVSASGIGEVFIEDSL